MKKLFTLCIAIFSLTYLYGQEDILLDDFESGVVSFTDEVHGNPPASMDYAIVDNPVKAGINTSNKVWEWKRYDASPDPNQIWAGFWSVLKTEVPSGYARIEIKYLRKNSTSQLKIKCEGAITKEIAAVTPASKTNEWETLVFDLTANGIKNIRVFGFFPDYYEPIDPTAVSYVDDIKIIYDGSIIIPTPTSLLLFDNSASDRFHDQSWVNQTAPSTVVTENWQGPGMADGDKLPCVTDPVKSGPNALQLKWKSAETGNWMALVASIGWLSFDLTTMDQLKFWVYSPTVLAKTELPKFYFESHSGNPNKSGSLPLGNYLNGIAANTWTEVIVPLADVWAADGTFTAIDLVKGIFFAQNGADNAEHTLFMDDFTFINTKTGLQVKQTDQAVKVYYSNGGIHISDYSGKVQVFDLLGKKVAEGVAVNGYLRMNLKNGIYIVNSGKGNSRIAIQ